MDMDEKNRWESTIERRDGNRPLKKCRVFPRSTQPPCRRCALRSRRGRRTAPRLGLRGWPRPPRALTADGRSNHRFDSFIRKPPWKTPTSLWSEKTRDEGSVCPPGVFISLSLSAFRFRRAGIHRVGTIIFERPCYAVLGGPAVPLPMHTDRSNAPSLCAPRYSKSLVTKDELSA